jgi:repressor LexA
MNLTPKQLDLLSAINSYRHVHGYSPSFRELAKQLGRTATAIVYAVDALVKKGALRRVPHKGRSLEVIIPMPGERATKLPIVGTIAAGAGAPLEVSDRESVDLEQLFVSKRGTYVLKVRGDSMIDDHICDGDFVIIDRRDQARDGEIVVAVLELGRATLKRYYQDGKNVRLQAANATVQPIVVPADKCQVMGVVIGLIRDPKEMRHG